MKGKHSKKLSPEGSELQIHFRRFLRGLGQAALEKESRERGIPPEDVEKVGKE